MLSQFILAIALNIAGMFVLDVILNRRVHYGYLRHFVVAMAAFGLLLAALWGLPAGRALDGMTDWQRGPGGPLLGLLRVLGGVLLFDAFVYVVHRYLEHGPLWSWHRSHHAIVDDHELTYYSPCPIEAGEVVYYLGMQMGTAALLGMGPIETMLFMTWVFQHGGYVHQRGLPELPWPMLSGSHHRTHHFAPKRYYSGLFLFWDRPDPIDRRAIEGFQRPKRRGAPG